MEIYSSAVLKGQFGKNCAALAEAPTSLFWSHTGLIVLNSLSPFQCCFFLPHDVLVRRPENAPVVILGVISTILDSGDCLKMVTIGTHRYPKWNGHANKGNTCQKFCGERIIACPHWQIGSTRENSWWAGLLLGSEGPNGLVAHSQSWLMT